MEVGYLSPIQIFRAKKGDTLIRDPTCLGVGPQEKVEVSFEYQIEYSQNPRKRIGLVVVLQTCGVVEGCLFCFSN